MKGFFALFAFCALCACAAPTIPVTLPDGFAVRAEVADTPEKAEKGLMHREKLAENEGMLFVFEEEAPRVFWMKNTFIDLDIIFLAADGSVTSAALNVPRSYSYTPDNQVAYINGYGQYVLELAGGTIAKHGLAKGVKIGFKLK